jgi:hypothetical protein
MVSKILRYRYENRPEVWEELLREDRQTDRQRGADIVSLRLSSQRSHFYASVCNGGFFVVLTPYIFF